MIGQAPSFSVSDFVAVFNQSLDMLYPEVIVEGELANLRISKGKWVYFDLKDENATLKCFGTSYMLPGPMEEGMTLQVVGQPHLHSHFNFSFNIRQVQISGEGSLRKAAEMLRRQLEAEGLFDESRKRTVPYPPETIALVASSESAAYGDFMKVIARRWPVAEVVLYEAQVQGREAPTQIIAAIEASNRDASAEVLVVIRGGGSRDDLACFDHEQVVRAVAASRLPTLVAIGHERDVALAELAADVRASTPSNAVELLVPDVASEQADLRAKRQYAERIISHYASEVDNKIIQYKQTINHILTGAVDRANQQIQLAGQLVAAYDPRNVLTRGYAIVRDETGKPLVAYAAASQHARLTVEFVDGKLEVFSKERR